MSAKSMARAVLKRMAAPFTRRIYGRIDLRAAELHEDLNVVPSMIETRTSELAAQIEALDRYLPVVINTIASQNAATRETRRRLVAHDTRLEALDTALADHAVTIGQIFERIEFVRRELLLEQRYAHNPEVGVNLSESGDTPPAPLARVTNPDKLESMRGMIRINVGAGHLAKDEYLNVDSRELPGIDVVADARDLPFAHEELREIYSAHVLEHFPVEELRRVILPGWVAMLEDGGKIVAVVPDVETMVGERAAGRMSFEDFIEVMYGGQEYSGDFHFSGYSKETLTALFHEVGLEDVKVIEEGRRNGACYEMEIEAVRRIPSSE